MKPANPLLLSLFVVLAPSLPAQRPPTRGATTPQGTSPKGPPLRGPRMGFGWGPNVRSPGESGKPGPTVSTKVKPKTPRPAERKRIASLIAKLEKHTPLRSAGVVWGLNSPIGNFGDIDGDRRQEFVAIETTPKTALLTVFFERGGVWRYLAAPLDALRTSQPRAPRVLADDGRGRPAIVIPADKAPYLYLVPVDAKGALLVGRARSLERHLPKRTSGRYRYVVGELAAGRDGAPAKIAGSLVEATPDDGVLERSWEILVLGERVTSRFGARVPGKELPAVVPAEHRILWQDFDGDGHTDALSTSESQDGKEIEVTLRYGAGRENATELREIETLAAAAPPPAIEAPPTLSFARTRDEKRPLYCIFFRPWRVGIFLFADR